MSFDLKITKGDIRINPDGTLEMVIDNPKLRQDIIKIMLTALGENKYHPTYGSDIGALKIGSIPSKALLEADLTRSAETAVRKIMSLQRAQAKRQYLRPGEKIISILNISAERNDIDPRQYNVFISVQTQALTPLTEVVTVRVI